MSRNRSERFVCASISWRPEIALGEYVGYIGPGYGMIHVPLACSPLVSVPSLACIRMLVSPANDGRNANDRFNVNVLPDPATDEAAAFSSHLLFCKMPADPGVMGPRTGPASLLRYKRLLGLS